MRDSIYDDQGNFVQGEEHKQTTLFFMGKNPIDLARYTSTNKYLFVRKESQYIDANTLILEQREKRITKIVETAEQYLGVPYQDRQCSPEAMDCVGFLGLVCQGAKINIPFPDNYSKLVQDDRILCYLDRYLPRKFTLDIKSTSKINFGVLIKPSDLLVFKFCGYPHHLAIASKYRLNRPYCIHASQIDGEVVEHAVSGKFLKRLVAIYDTGKAVYPF